MYYVKTVSIRNFENLSIKFCLMVLCTQRGEYHITCNPENDAQSCQLPVVRLAASAALVERIYR